MHHRQISQSNYNPDEWQHLKTRLYQADFHLDLCSRLLHSHLKLFSKYSRHIFTKTDYHMTCELDWIQDGARVPEGPSGDTSIATVTLSSSGETCRRTEDN